MFIKKIITPEKDDESLRNAMLIKNEKVLIEILSTRAYQQRQKKMTTFDKKYNKDIIQELQKYFSGETSFNEFVNGLFTNPIEYDCLS